jgi:uncharacterized protein YbjT (DUF2867 family)
VTSSLSGSDSRPTTRVLGDSLRRIADAEIRIVHVYVHERLTAAGASRAEVAPPDRRDPGNLAPLIDNSSATDRDEAVAYFGTTTRTLLAAEQRAGVRHQVLLSIVGVDRIEGNAHYAGEREQERLVAGGRVPWTIVRATQFHDFAAVDEWLAAGAR